MGKQEALPSNLAQYSGESSRHVLKSFLAPVTTQGQTTQIFYFILPVRGIGTNGGGKLGLPLVAVGKELLLVVQQLLAGLGGVLGVGALDDGVDGARLLAVAAVDALGHVDVVARRAAGAVGPLLGLDGDGLRRAHGLAELAGDAALFAGGVAAEGVFAAEAGGNGALQRHITLVEMFSCAIFSSFLLFICPPPLTGRKEKDAHLLKRIVNGIGRPEELLQQHVHAAEHLSQEKVSAQLVERALLVVFPSRVRLLAESGRRRTGRRGVASDRSGGGRSEEAVRESRVDCRGAGEGTSRRSGEHGELSGCRWCHCRDREEEAPIDPVVNGVLGCDDGVAAEGELSRSAHSLTLCPGAFRCGITTPGK